MCTRSLSGMAGNSMYFCQFNEMLLLFKRVCRGLYLRHPGLVHAYVLYDREEICERQKRYGWGKSIVEDLALELREAFAGRTGFSARNWTKIYLILEK